jgi:hypothetical protein
VGSPLTNWKMWLLLLMPSYAIDAEGKAEIAVGDCDATIHLCGDGEVGIMWRNAEGRPVKTAPSYIKAAFPKEAGVLRS